MILFCFLSFFFFLISYSFIQDWAYTGELNSTPTVVKSKELYEVSRLLGRGSFGEVLLGKNIEDNKM